MSVRDDIEEMIARLPRLRHDFDMRSVPASGVYFLFEDTEPDNRIVRVGTHRVDYRLPRRLRCHFKESKRTSVFRYHIGSALLENDERLATWMIKNAATIEVVEAQIDQIMCEHVSFCCLRIDERAERLNTEATIIGALARDPRISDHWRGRHAARPAIRQSGLWNVEHIGHSKPVDIARMDQLVRLTLESL